MDESITYTESPGVVPPVIMEALGLEDVSMDDTPIPIVSNFGLGPIPGGLLKSQGRFITSREKYNLLFYIANDNVMSCSKSCVNHVQSWRFFQELHQLLVFESQEFKI